MNNNNKKKWKLPGSHFDYLLCSCTSDKRKVVWSKLTMKRKKEKKKKVGTIHGTICDNEQLQNQFIFATVDCEQAWAHFHAPALVGYTSIYKSSIHTHTHTHTIKEKREYVGAAATSVWWRRTVTMLVSAGAHTHGNCNAATSRRFVELIDQTSDWREWLCCS